MLVALEQPAFEERHDLVEEPGVGRRRDVLQRRVDEPEPIVRELGPHALAARFVPPVLDVAFDELSRGGMDDVVAREVRSRQHQREDILQLVAEAERAARLIERRSSPDAAREGLIEEPVVEQQIHRPIGRADLHRPEQRPPEVLHVGKRRGDSLRCAAAPDER